MYPTTSCAARFGPSGCRAARHGPRFARQLSGGPNFFPPAAFWGAVPGRHHPFLGHGRGGDFSEHLNNFVNQTLDSVFPFAQGVECFTRGASEPFTWQPRFDVSEADGVYQLRGELPGVEAQNLDIEFTDANTLVVRGKTETERSEGTQAQQQAPQEGSVNATATENAHQTEKATPAEKDADAASVHSESSYVKPTVEDEAEAPLLEKDTGTTSAADAATPNTGNTVADHAPEQQVETGAQQPRYWVSERSVGSFQRTFSFPSRVDAEGVTASLKNGILDIAVPKAKAPEARKITLQ